MNLKKWNIGENIEERTVRQQRSFLSPVCPEPVKLWIFVQLPPALADREAGKFIKSNGGYRRIKRAIFHCFLPKESHVHGMYNPSIRDCYP